MKKYLIYSIITALTFTTFEPFSKLIANDVTPYAITFWRFLIGALVLFPFALGEIRKNKLSVSAKDWAILALMGAILVAVIMTSLQSAVKIADSPAVISMVFSTNSVFTILFSSIILKDKITKNKIIAMVLCVIGLLLCTDFSSGTNLKSLGLVLFSAISFSLYTVFSKRYMKKIGGITQSAITFSAGSIVLLLVLLIAGVDVSVPMEIKPISFVVYFGIVVTGIGYWSYFKGIEKGGPIIGSLAFFIKPVLTPFVTFFVNGIVPDIKVFAALLFIVLGSYYAVYKKEA